MMHKHYWQTGILVFLIGIYLLIFYLVLTYAFKLDFTSFYSASLYLKNSENPYLVLIADYLPVPRTLSNNLCPPIFLWLLYPLFQLPYLIAVIIWLTLSIILGLVGAHIAFYYAFPAKFVSKNRLSLYLGYLALFSTIMNIAIGQIGAILLFFMMLGYHFYQQNRTLGTGVIWGLIIAVKFFPALLFFYVLKEKNYKVFTVMLMTVLCCILIPLAVYGPDIYYQYYNLMIHILWYADSWNASIYGFVFRTVTHSYALEAHTRVLISVVCFALFIIGLLVYLYFLFSAERSKNKSIKNHYHFCLTLLFMLLLSPLGWMYYFSILLLPLCLYWTSAIQSGQSMRLVWGLFILFLLNFPVDYVRIENMPGVLERATFYSIHFYGLLLFTYTLCRQKKLVASNNLNSLPDLSGIIAILAFGVFIPTASFLMDLFA